MKRNIKVAINYGKEIFTDLFVKHEIRFKDFSQFQLVKAH